tara:strand:- start:374 stop:853 length:480 start_codon:yes stop_codon:yes gene_type:complete
MTIEILALNTEGEVMMLETREDSDITEALQSLTGGNLEALELPVPLFEGKHITLFINENSLGLKPNIIGTALAKLAFERADQCDRADEICLYGVALAAHEYINEEGDSVFEIIPEELFSVLANIIRAVQNQPEGLVEGAKLGMDIQNRRKCLKEIAENN